MKLLRKIGKILVGAAFSLLFTLAIFLFFTIQLLDYNNLKGIVVPMLKNQMFSTLNQTEINAIYRYFLYECEGKTNITQSIDGFNFTVDCEKLQAAGANKSIDLIADSLFDEIYYKEYSCEISECIKQDKAFLVSFSFYQQLKDLFKYLLALVIASGILYLALMETWPERLNSLGSTFLLTGASYILVLFSKMFLPAQLAELYPAFLSLFKPLLYFLIVGVALIAVAQIIKKKK